MGQQNTCRVHFLFFFQIKEKPIEIYYYFLLQRISSRQQVALIDSLVGADWLLDFKWWNDVWRAALSISESLKSGCGLFLVGNVCDLDPPLANNSRSFELRHFMRRFWNHIFTYNSNDTHTHTNKKKQQN
ncbi:hypothetical protein OUZ56_020854 [Daphnia magna]|uniref:Uncharacterized protein n=1 Tax=Daphnia magna TaxID=35525 RepID=A0ABQ9ZH53_9CRUS|nr:hypothetical protein OUZ56_020854 [Daphnia magna]